MASGGELALVFVHGGVAATGAVLFGFVHALVGLGRFAIEVFEGCCHGGTPPGVNWQNPVNKRVTNECVLFTTPCLLKRLGLRVGVYYLPHLSAVVAG